MPANVPYVTDLAKTQEQRDLLLVLNDPSEVGRPLIVAKEVPRERVATLRAALGKMLEDQSFLREAQKQNPRWIPSLTPRRNRLSDRSTPLRRNSPGR